VNRHWATHTEGGEQMQAIVWLLNGSGWEAAASHDPLFHFVTTGFFAVALFCGLA